jgi:hypothetical protein
VDAKQIEINRRNIDALVQGMAEQGKVITNLERQIQVQAQALTTLDNLVKRMMQSMANATASLGTGPTVR